MRKQAVPWRLWCGRNLNRREWCRRIYINAAVWVRPNSAAGRPRYLPTPQDKLICHSWLLAASCTTHSPSTLRMMRKRMMRKPTSELLRSSSSADSGSTWKW